MKQQQAPELQKREAAAAAAESKNTGSGVLCVLSLGSKRKGAIESEEEARSALSCSLVSCCVLGEQPCGSHSVEGVCAVDRALGDQHERERCRAGRIARGSGITSLSMSRHGYTFKHLQTDGSTLAHSTRVARSKWKCGSSISRSSNITRTSISLLLFLLRGLLYRQVCKTTSFRSSRAAATIVKSCLQEACQVAHRRDS